MTRVVLRPVILAVVILATLGASALAGNPKRAAVHNKQGKAYFDAKQYDDAIVEFKKAYELDAKPVTLFKIASAYYAKGDFKGAIEYYQNYLTADPEGPFAAQAIEFSTIANKALADEVAKQQAASEAARRKSSHDLATARIKQAEAYAEANAWVSAGEEYTAAADVGNEPAHLLDAAAAFRNAPDDEKARAAYLAYLEKVPHGAKSDEVRGQVAELTRSIAKAEAEARERQRAPQSAVKPTSSDVTWTVEPRVAPPARTGLVEVSIKAGTTASKLDTVPASWQATAQEDAFIGNGFAIGASLTYAFTNRLSVQPELLFARRGYGIENCGGPNECGEDGFTLQVDSIDLPLLARVDLATGGRFRAGLAAGPLLSVAIDHRIKDRLAGSSTPSDLDTTSPSFGLVAGLELRYWAITVAMRIQRGLSPLAEDLDATPWGIVFLAGFAPLAR